MRPKSPRGCIASMWTTGLLTHGTPQESTGQMWITARTWAWRRIVTGRTWPWPAPPGTCCPLLARHALGRRSRPAQTRRLVCQARRHRLRRARHRPRPALDRTAFLNVTARPEQGNNPVRAPPQPQGSRVLPSLKRPKSSSERQPYHLE